MSKINMLNLKKIRALSLDITGTLLIHAKPISQTYYEAAIYTKLNNPPSNNEIHSNFKKSFKQMSIDYPCYGSGISISHNNKISSREWWKKTIMMTLNKCDKQYNSNEFEKFFRRIYQSYGSPESYEVMKDSIYFLNWLKNEKILTNSIGICSNTPLRLIDTVLVIL